MKRKESEEKLGYSNPIAPAPAYNGVLTSPIVKGVDAIGPDEAIDGGFENWIIKPQGCDVDGYDADLDATVSAYFPTRSTDSQGGTYALKFNGGGTNKLSMFSVDVAGLAEADEILGSFYAKHTGTGTIKVVVEYDDGGDTYGLNWTGASQGTFTLEGGLPSADQTYSPALTNAYAPYSTPLAAVVPAGVNTLTILIYSEDADVYVDTISYTKNGGAPTVNDFETWELYTAGELNNSNRLYGCDVAEAGSSTFGTVLREGTIKFAGSYSMKITSGSGGFYANYQVKTGLTYDYYDVSIAGYTPSANTSGIAAFAIFDMNISEPAVKHWNPDTQAWVAGVEGSAITLDSAEDAWVEATVRAAKPESNQMVIAFLNEGGAEGDIAYLDAFQFESVTLAQNVTLFDNVNASDESRMASSDWIFRNRTTGGTDKDWFSQKGDGSMHTDLDVFDFETAQKPTQVHADKTNQIAALNQESGMSILSETAAIDFKVATTHTLYTVPTGYTLYLYDVPLRRISADNYTVGWEAKIGANDPDYNDWSNNYAAVATINYIDTSLPSSIGPLGRKAYNAGSVIKLVITSGATATTLTNKLYLMGFLIPNA